MDEDFNTEEYAKTEQIEDNNNNNNNDDDDEEKKQAEEDELPYPKEEVEALRELPVSLRLFIYFDLIQTNKKKCFVLI